MNREKLLQNPLPIDRVAARVVRGKGENWQQRTHMSQPVFDDLPSIRPFTPALMGNPSWTDLTGITFGRMTVVGLAEAKKSSGAAIWVCRCSCSAYVTLRTRTIKAQQGDVAQPFCCPRCNAKRKMRGERF